MSAYRQQLIRAIENLYPVEQQVLSLRICDELSLHEISNVLELELDIVGKVYINARRKVANKLHRASLACKRLNDISPMY